MQLEPMTEKQMIETLQNLKENEKNNAIRSQIIEQNLKEAKESAELISHEEAILVASMPGIKYGDKVDSSGDIYHDELLRTLEKSKKIRTQALQDLYDERDEIFLENEYYKKLRRCVRKVCEELRKYLNEYFIAHITADEAINKLHVSRATFFRQSQRAIEVLTRIYNMDALK